MIWTQQLVGMLVGSLVWYFFVMLAIAMSTLGIYSLVYHLRGVETWEDKSYLYGGCVFLAAGLMLALFMWFTTLPSGRADAPPTPTQTQSQDMPF